MADRAGIRKEYDKKHFMIDEVKLRKVCDVLHEHAKRLEEKTHLSFYVEREDDSYYETRTIEEVLADDNVPAKAIRTVTIELQRTNPPEKEKLKPEGEPKPLAYIALYRLRDLKVVFFVAGDKRDWTFLLADELDTQIQRFLTPNNLRWFTSRFADLVILFFLGSIALTWLLWLSKSVPPELTSKQISSMSVDVATRKILEVVSKNTRSLDYAAPISMLFMAFMIAIIEIRPVSRLLSKMSRSVFYWGDMIAIQDRFRTRMTQLKYGVGVAFIISVLGSIIATVLIK